MTMNVYAFEELAACFVFGDFKMPQTWTRAHRQCANPEGGKEYAENNEFHRFL